MRHNLATSFISEYAGLLSILPARESAALLTGTMLRMPEIIRTRKLIPIDKYMSTDLSVRINKKRLNVPCRTIDSELGEGWTFGGVREMYANNIYLRRFNEVPKISTVIDVGSNRGLFTLLAKKVLGAELVIRIEVQQKYMGVFGSLMKINECSTDDIREYYKECSNYDSDNTISINTIVSENNVSEIDLMKIDIEGAEIDLFAKNTEWLTRCNNIVMELHPHFVSVAHIPSLLRDSGFETIVTDQDDRIVESPDAMEFLYASRTPGAIRK